MPDTERLTALQTRLNGMWENFWRTLSVALLGLLLTVFWYYIRASEARWEKNEKRWSDLYKWHLDQAGKLSKIETRQDAILKQLERGEK